jgi:Ala-tRNA(Pro) deacylase
MADSPFERLTTFLSQQGVSCDVLHHAPVYTSQEAASVRGTPLASGAKALVCKGDDRFVLIVLPADRKLAGKLARQELGIKSLRFASREEVEQLTGLAPGSIPPFGSLFGLATYCDRHLADQPRINFNAGDHAISISMTYADYAAAEKPTMGTFAE